ncbi:MAG: hemerythrin domain-containing protein [Reyranella sp.]|uniref:hemerythrin domain-containing protein n=1 Tax=Reyranella sp. TaxID=1929291 RepID=UPI003D0A0049
MSAARRKAAQARRRGDADDVNPDDALVLLTAEHNAIEKLVREFARRAGTMDGVEKGKLALRICHALANHHAIKAEVFYPAAEAVLDDEDRGRIDALRVDHEVLLDLIEEVERMPAEHREFDSHVRDLGDLACRLMKAEEENVFPLLRHSRLDLVGTGERMAARKSQLATRPVDRALIRQARRVMGGARP